jgi:hypothetical protein
VLGVAHYLVDRDTVEWYRRSKAEAPGRGACEIRVVVPG